MRDEFKILGFMVGYFMVHTALEGWLDKVWPDTQAHIFVGVVLMIIFGGPILLDLLKR